MRYANSVNPDSRYLAESGREIKELYRGTNHSWTALLRRANLLNDPAPEGEAALLKRASAFLHVDDPGRAAAYTRLLEDNAQPYDELAELDRAYARMLLFTLWPLGGFDTYQGGLDSLRNQHAVCSELRPGTHARPQSRGTTSTALPGAHSNLPLRVHASYSREEILTALGESTLEGLTPGHFREGVKRGAGQYRRAADHSGEGRKGLLTADPLQGLREDDTFSTGSRRTKHPSRHPQASTFTCPIARRALTYYSSCAATRRPISAPQPWMLLGPADYVSHEGNKPMGISGIAHSTPRRCLDLLRHRRRVKIELNCSQEPSGSHVDATTTGFSVAKSRSPVKATPLSGHH